MYVQIVPGELTRIGAHRIQSEFYASVAKIGKRDNLKNYCSNLRVRDPSLALETRLRTFILIDLRVRIPAPIEILVCEVGKHKWSLLISFLNIILSAKLLEEHSSLNCFSIEK